MINLKKVSTAFLLGLSFALPPFIFSCGKHSTGESELPRILTIGEVTTAIDSARDSLVVFDLYADWCVPCRMLEPTMDKLAKSYKGKVLFYRINLDQVPEAGQKFGSSSIPYIVFVKDTAMVASLVGVQPEEEYVKIIRQFSALSSAIHQSSHEKK
jgi:thioredoxin